MLYDVEKEMCEAQFTIRSELSGATAVTVGEISRGGNVFAVGCRDGVIRVFDRRCSPRESMVHCLAEHRGAILGLGAPAETKIISASTAGEVKIWDITAASTTSASATAAAGSAGPSALKTMQYDGLAAFAVHKNASLMACGSSQSIDIYTHDGEKCRSMKSIGFLGQRFSSVSTLAFHPYKLLLAAAFRDSLIHLYASSKK